MSDSEFRVYEGRAGHHDSTLVAECDSWAAAKCHAARLAIATGRLHSADGWSGPWMANPAAGGDYSLEALLPDLESEALRDRADRLMETIRRRLDSYDRANKALRDADTATFGLPEPLRVGVRDQRDALARWALDLSWLFVQAADPGVTAVLDEPDVQPDVMPRLPDHMRDTIRDGRPVQPTDFFRPAGPDGDAVIEREPALVGADDDDGLPF
jgi:hypothetical protein